MAKFTETFSNFTTPGDTVSTAIDGFTIVARIVLDNSSRVPWEDCGGHGIVTDWTRRDATKGERVLSRDGADVRYYDFAASLKKALRDGWSAAPHNKGTKRDRATRAVERDFEYLRSWCNDEWCFVGVVLSVSKKGVVLAEHAASVWGIESNDGAYLTDTAEELIGEALDVAKDKLAALLDA